METMKRYFRAALALSLLLLLAVGCGSPIGSKSAVAEKSGGSTLTITIQKPDYAALAVSQANASGTTSGSSWRSTSSIRLQASSTRLAGAAAETSGSRVVDPGSSSVDLYLVPDGGPTTVPPDAAYKVGNVAFTASATSSDSMPASGQSASFTVNSGTYALAYFRILDSSGTVLTKGGLAKGDAYGNGTWDGSIASGSASLALTGFPATCTVLTPANPTTASVASGQVKYFSFTPESGRIYQFVIWGPPVSKAKIASASFQPKGSAPAAAGGELLVLYGSNGKKAATPYSTSTGSGLGILTANYSGGSPYLAVYGSGATPPDFAVIPVPEYQGDGTPVHGTLLDGDHDPLDSGAWLCFSVQPGVEYQLDMSSAPEAVPYVSVCDSSGNSILSERRNPSSSFTVPVDDTLIYVNAYNRDGSTYGPDYSISVAPISPTSTSISVGIQ
jgi:hypothetical protein